MRISVVASELPHPQGTAAGRDLWAWCEGLRALGHELDAWIWRRSPSSPEGPVPEWCRYEPYEVGPMWRAHLRSIRDPRGHVARAGWEPATGAVAVADHLWSEAAVSRFPKSVATFHFRTIADARAVRRLRRSDIQMARAERIAGRRAKLSLVYSERLGRRLRGPVRYVPIALEIPVDAVPCVERPVAALMADWSWPPNRTSLKWLFEAWPRVRRDVPGARLLIGGRGSEDIGTAASAGVEVVGAVARSEDLLSQAAVIAFPCPASSGPKVKVLEALAHGVPVVTTPPGIEGLVLEPETGAVAVGLREFPGALADLLRSPEQRAKLGASGRDQISEHHSPVASARARVRAFSEAFGAG
ncbi:MAG: glycosyltransferase family 4 protein [Acidimicrobiales bacterium]